jgi:hypothetical protein
VLHADISLVSDILETVPERYKAAALSIAARWATAAPLHDALRSFTHNDLVQRASLRR